MPAQPERREAPRTPVGRVLLALLITGVLTGGACWVITWLAPAQARALVGWYGGISAGLVSLAVAAVVLVVGCARATHQQLTTQEDETRQMVDETLPALVTRMREGASATTALAEVSRPETDVHQRLLSTLGREIGDGERMRAAAMSACANAAGRVQALSTSMLADLRDMESRHDEDVLGDLLKVDHSTAQAGRVADSIAVLTGARTGRRWTKPIVMESILRGAVGRISAYQRVQLHCASTVAVAGYAAEGVMHALAELMDNATNFSPPSERVHVYVEEVQAGVVVTIDDAGLVMRDMALQRAEKAVSAEPLDLASLSGTRLGLAVVGCLARKHNLTVSFRPSARGGTGVVVMIPRKLIKEPRQQPGDTSQAPTTGQAPTAGSMRSASAASATASAIGSAGARASAGTATVTGAGASGDGAPSSDWAPSGSGALTTSTSSVSSGNSPSPHGFPTAIGEVDATESAGLSPADPQASAREDEATGEKAVTAEPPDLPRRQRGATLAQSAARPAETTKPSRPLPDPGTRFGAFRRASRPNADGENGRRADASRKGAHGESSRGDTARGNTVHGDTARGDD